MKNQNGFLTLGVLLVAVNIVSTRFAILPDFIEGLCVGAGLTFIVLGFFASRYDLAEFRKRKMKFLASMKK